MQKSSPPPGSTAPASGGRLLLILPVAVACLLALGIAGASLYLQRLSTAPAARATAGPPDTVRVLSAAWVAGQPNAFRIRVRLLRADGLPVKGATVGISDAATGTELPLRGRTTHFENWKHSGKQGYAETTIRAILTSRPTAPMTVGIDGYAAAPQPPPPFWARWLPWFYQAPPVLHPRRRLAGDVARLPVPR